MSSSTSSADAPWFYRLDCPVRDYDWGNPAPDGIIRSLLDPGRAPPAGKPAAELWMGAHPSAPSRIVSASTPARYPEGGLPLDQAIAANPEHFLGPVLTSAGITRLPFLFKILDAGRALSIQAHPDKNLASELHRRDPVNYPDDNHKPELAISLGGMSALVGFRPRAEIDGFLGAVSELRALCDVEVPTPDDPAWIKARYARLMRSEPEQVGAATESLLSELHRHKNTFPNESRLFRDLSELYSHTDPGLFCVFFLNYQELAQGEAVFLGPNEPHAYLGGPIVECMAASDNVVRAGLTGKYVDRDTLIEMLHYRTRPREVERARSSDAGLGHYPVPVPDFSVEVIQGEKPARELSDADRPSISIVLEGEVEMERDAEPTSADGPAKFRRGDVCLLPGDLAARGIRPSLRLSSDALLYRASTRLS